MKSNSDYIIMGDKGCIRKDLILAVVQSGSQVLIGSSTFGFSDYETARAAVTDVIAQLNGQQLQQQMVDWSKPIQTRGGQPARLVTVIKGTFNHVVVVDDKQVIQVTEGGLWQGEPYAEPMDIVNVPPKKMTGEFWVNIYPDGSSAAGHLSRAEADKLASTNRVACKRVQWTEGEGL